MIRSDSRPADPGLFLAHAENLDVLRSLLGEVRLAGQQCGQDPTVAFGPACGGILAGLSDRYARHQEQLAYVEDNLLLMVQGLHRVAEGKQELKELIRREDDVATRDGTPVIDDPPYSLRGLMDSVIAHVQDREWVESQLDAAPVAEFAAPADETGAALRSIGLSCLLRHVDPLRQLLEDLTGSPDMVASQAAAWHTISADLDQLSVFLRQCLDHDLPRQDRLDVRSYLAFMAHNVEALIGLAETATAAAVIVQAAGTLILLTHDIIRGIIGDLAASTIRRTFDPSTVVTRPVMAARLGIIVATTWRIHAYTTAQTTSLITLCRMLDG